MRKKRKVPRQYTESENSSQVKKHLQLKNAENVSFLNHLAKSFSGLRINTYAIK